MGGLIWFLHTSALLICTRSDGIASRQRRFSIALESYTHIFLQLLKCPKASESIFTRALSNKNQKLLRSSRRYAVITSSSSSTLLLSTRRRLSDLFLQIEYDFELLYAENISLNKRLERSGRAM